MLKINKQKLVITSVLIAAALSMTALAIPTSSESSYVYTQSDIIKANPNLVMGIGDSSMVEDIEIAKDYVVLTVSGSVLSVGDPVNWIEHESGETYGSVPITMEVDKKTKNTLSHLKTRERRSIYFLFGWSL